jgi:hypothetical protein
MRVVDVVEGGYFHTRITKRGGLVVRHTPDRGTLVWWEDGQPSRFLHPDVEVDEGKPSREEVVR